MLQLECPAGHGVINIDHPSEADVRACPVCGVRAVPLRIPLAPVVIEPQLEEDAVEIKAKADKKLKAKDTE